MQSYEQTHALHTSGLDQNSRREKATAFGRMRSGCATRAGEARCPQVARVLSCSRTMAASRTENLVAWFAASVLVTAGVVYILKLEREERPDALCVPPRAS